jgi:SAM-dependent methyltransferase
MFRTPTDDPSKNLLFYENEYEQGFTTDLPSDATLVEMKRTNFVGTENCYSYYIDVLTKLELKPGNRVFDYGCSWGYGSYQLAQAGFDVVSFEVAPRRSSYACEKLDVRTINEMDRGVNDFSGYFDCFFSAHVIEHVPSPAEAFSYAMRLLKRGGLFVSFTPNGCAAHRAVSPHWSKAWGEVHPNFIDDIFLDNSFKRSPRAVGSSPVLNASLPTQIELKRLNNLDGAELFFAARKSSNAWK